MHEDSVRTPPPAAIPKNRNGGRPGAALASGWVVPAGPQRPLYVKSKTLRLVRKAIAQAAARQRIQLDESTAGRVRLGGSHHKPAVGYDLPPQLLRGAREELEAELPVVRALPRRVQASTETFGTFTRPQMHLATAPKVGPLRTLGRLGVWIGALLYFTVGNLWDRLRGRNSEARRSRRLRRAFERVGGTFVKIGQQMASRLDLLPLRYCEELSAMLDRYPAFPAEQAIAIVERATGKKLDELFAGFDPEPIGSASIACVYQAVLRETGEKVAVKVQRPRIRELFEADFKVLDLLIGLGEALTLIRPGMGTSIRDEFRTTLASELDFRREARIQEIYERRARKAKIRFFSAPKIYAAYSNDEVIVQEFVSGMWMYEVLAGVEQHDPVALARMAELNIDPQKLARRLLFMNCWGVFESLAFHADPHPANIVVRVNSELVFIDFGACGYFDQPRRDLYVRLQEGYRKENIWEMAQMGVALSEPLPPLDVNQVTREIERNYYNQILAIKSKHTPWYERTSANTWIGALRLLSKYKVSAPPDLLMYARSTLLYDTLAARLDPTINFYKEAARYFKWSRRRSQRRGKAAMRRVLRRGLVDNVNFQQAERTLDTLNSLIFRVQRLFAAPYDFAVLPFVIEKWIYVALMIIRFVVQCTLIGVLAVGLTVAARAAQGQNALLWESILQVAQSPIYLAAVALLAIIHIRLILFRLGEKTAEV